MDSVILRNVFILINYLQKNKIPHNIYVTRALNKELNFNNLEVDLTRNCVRVFIWARTPSGKALICVLRRLCSIQLNCYKIIIKLFILIIPRQLVNW